MEPIAAEWIDLGNLLGQNQAFEKIASRCSAAQAAAIRRLREEKLYRHITVHWGEFCAAHLKMSKTRADQIISLLNTFGPGYFELSQLTRISPQIYRALEPAVKDGVLHFQGEMIPINEENAERIGAAVASLRRKKSSAMTSHRRAVPALLEDIIRRCESIVVDLQSIARKERYGEHWLKLVSTIGKVRDALERLDLENGGG